MLVDYTYFTQGQAVMTVVNGTTAINLGLGDFILINGAANASLWPSDFLFTWLGCRTDCVAVGAPYAKPALQFKLCTERHWALPCAATCEDKKIL